MIQRIGLFTLFLPLFALHISSVYGGLYVQGDHVTILDDSNFKQIVCNSASAWVVQFYNSWCGHCIRFVPTWKTFANDVSEWKTVVQVGNVDCADKHNTGLCREYNIQSYPSIKVFGPFASETDAGDAYTEVREITTLRHGIINMLERHTKDRVPDVWPNWKPIHSTDALKSISADVVAVIVEAESSYIGKEVILDLSGQRRVNVSRIQPQDASNLPDITHLPALYTLDKKNNQFVLKTSQIQNRTSATFILQEMIGYTTKHSVDKVETTDATIERTPQKPKTKVYMKDLESALLYSLTREVAGMKYITDKKLNTVQRYTKVLAKYFPGDHRLSSSLKQLSEWTSRKSAMTGQQFGAFMKKVQEHNPSFPKKIEWKGCQGSQEKFRGYPCSLWILFHALTVNSVLEHGKEPGFDSTEVLYAMREYVRYFFGCKECSDHFTKAAARMETEVTSPDASIIWLWKSHNRANFFLKGDETEDPAHPKIQFPSSADCPPCHSGEEFDEAQVLAFMKTLYSRRNIVTEELPGSSSKTMTYMQDLESTLVYSFTQELALQKQVYDDSYNNLKKFLKVVYKYFPGNDEMRAFLQEMVQWVELRSSFSGEDWATMVNNTQIKHPTVFSGIEWKACHGSEPKFRGYPCGLWVLFHTLTVNAYIGHQEVGTLGTYNPLEVLDSVKGYIHSFFGCRECSKNFAKMAVEIEVAVQEADDSITWLWNAHNRANKRLHGDNTEDPTHPKIQFPSVEECPQCHVKNPTSKLPWSIKEILAFLKHVYRKENIVGWMPTSVQLERQKVNMMEQDQGKIDGNEEREERYEKKFINALGKDEKLNNEKRRDESLGAGEGSDKKSALNPPGAGHRLQRIRNLRNMEMKTRRKAPVDARGGMNSIDVGLCVVFYVASTAIVLFLYFHFMVRKKHKLPCNMCPV